MQIYRYDDDDADDDDGNDDDNDDGDSGHKIKIIILISKLFRA